MIYDQLNSLLCTQSNNNLNQRIIKYIHIGADTRMWVKKLQYHLNFH